MSRELVDKNYCVMGVLDDDPPQQKPHQISRTYNVFAAAVAFAEECRKTLKRPDTVTVKTRRTYKADGDL